MTATTIEALGLFPGADREVAAALSMRGLRTALDLAAALITRDDAARLLRWLRSDPRLAAVLPTDPELLWRALADLRHALAKPGPQARGWVPPPEGDKVAPRRPSPALWSLELPASASVIPAALRAGPRDQNPRGTCVAFAACRTIEVLADDGVALSPQFLYHHMKQPERDRDLHRDGSWAGVALDVLSDVGVCSEAQMPYQAVDYVAQGEPVAGPPPSATAGAAAAGRRTAVSLLLHRGRGAEAVNTMGVEQLLAWLQALASPSPPPEVQSQLELLRLARAALSGALGVRPRAVIGCFRWFHSSERMAAEGGRLGLPLPDEDAVGGHAVAVVGYAEDASVAGGGYLVAQNSWGARWPRQSADGPAMFRISYAYAAAYLIEVGVPIEQSEAHRLDIATEPSAAAPLFPPASKAAQIGAAARFCTSCGGAFSPTARFCARCGAPRTGLGAAGAAGNGEAAAPSNQPSGPPLAGPVGPNATLPRSDGPMVAVQARLNDALARHTERLDALNARNSVAPAPRAASRCVYCRSSTYGACSMSPEGRHKHEADGRHCAWCGSSSYGTCGMSPHRKHEHGHGNGCRFCGSGSTGVCGMAPSGRHEH
jgi:hypothetical protein